MVLLLTLINITVQSETFGIQKKDWTDFKNKFNNHIEWILEYKRYSDSEWKTGNQYLTIEKSFDEYFGYWKFNLIFECPVDVYSARFTMGIERVVWEYVEREGYEVWINYSDYNCFFNWSDLASIPGVTFSKGVLDDMFWFRFKRDNIPAGIYSFDPWFGYRNPAAPIKSSLSFFNAADSKYECFRSLNTTFNGTTNAYADNISCRLYIYNAQVYGCNVTCGLYYAINGSFIRNTTQLFIDNDWAHLKWYTFEFDDPKPILTPNTKYHLSVYAEVGNSSNPTPGSTFIYARVIHQSSTNVNSHLKYFNNYPIWEDPLVNAPNNDENLSIYCNYTLISPTLPTVDNHPGTIHRSNTLGLSIGLIGFIFGLLSILQIIKKKEEDE